MIRRAATAIAVLAAMPAAAQEAFQEVRTGAWEIFQQEDQCWMSPVKVNRTILMFSTVKDDARLYVSVQGPMFRGIGSEETFAVQVSFGPHAGTVTARSLDSDPPGVSALLGNSPDSWLSQLRVAPSIRIEGKGRRFVQSLAGSAEAFGHLQACTRILRPNGAPPEQPRDPNDVP